MNKINFEVSGLIARDVSLPDLQNSLQALVKFFGPRVYQIVPRAIDQVPAADRAIWIAEKLTRIEKCRGFHAHLREYFNGVIPALFVSCLAAHLLVEAREVELEPDIPSHTKKPDLRVQVEDQEVFIECKCPIEDLNRLYLDEHQNIFDTLRGFVDQPYAFEISYKRCPNPEDLEAIGQLLKARLEHVSSTGKVTDSDNMIVKIQAAVDTPPLGVSLWVDLIVPDEESSLALPGHLIVRDGFSMILCGPVVDYTSILTDRVRWSRSKVPPGLPFAVAISSNRMLGSVARNLSALEGMFQPRKNTRISGVLLAEFTRAISEGDITKLRFIPNPYAAMPLTKAAQRVLTAGSNWPAK